MEPRAFCTVTTITTTTSTTAAATTTTTTTTTSRRISGVNENLFDSRNGFCSVKLIR